MPILVKGMSSEMEQRQALVTGYAQHKSQWVNRRYVNNY